MEKLLPAGRCGVSTSKCRQGSGVKSACDRNNSALCFQLKACALFPQLVGLALSGTKNKSNRYSNVMQAVYIYCIVFISSIIVGSAQKQPGLITK